MDYLREGAPFWLRQLKEAHGERPQPYTVGFPIKKGITGAFAARDL